MDKEFSTWQIRHFGTGKTLEQLELAWLDKLCLRCALRFKDISGLCWKCKEENRRR